MYEFYSPTEEEIEALHNVIEHYINTFNIQENIQFEMSLIYKDNHHVGIVIFDNENTISCLVKVDDDVKIVNRGDL